MQRVNAIAWTHLSRLPCCPASRRCTLNGERLRKAGAVGQAVLDALGTALVHADLARLRGLAVADVATLGKELFLFLAPAGAAPGSGEGGGDEPGEAGCVCVRVHFGMNGSLLVNSTHRYAGKTMPSLQLQLSRDVVRIYASTACLRCPSKTRTHIAKLKAQDVCASAFDAHAATASLVAHGSGCQRKQHLLVDALLDQSILPGSGNIIKNEALFRSGLDPFLPSGALTHPQALLLVRHVREFSLIFKKCRESAQSLKRHLFVYNRRECGKCATAVRVCRLGNDLSRVTFWCPACQPSNAGAGAAGQEAGVHRGCGGGETYRQNIHATNTCPASSVGGDEAAPPAAVGSGAVSGSVSVRDSGGGGARRGEGAAGVGAGLGHGEGGAGDRVCVGDAGAGAGFSQPPSLPMPRQHTLTEAQRKRVLYAPPHLPPPPLLPASAPPIFN